jgi:gliding motility-associated-like protein
MKKLVLGLFFLLGISAISVGQITSTFDKDTEGWLAPGSTGITYSATGGNPGGMVYGTNPAGTTFWYYSAPNAYLGNQSLYYNGTLSFDMALTGAVTSYSQRADIIIQGAFSLYYFNLTPTFPTVYPAWKKFSVPLNELSGAWKTANSSTAPAATQAQIQLALSNMKIFQIRGRYDIEKTIISTLDNVLLQPFYFIKQPPTPISVCIGTNVNLPTVSVGNGSVGYQWQKFNTAFGGWFNVNNGGGYGNATSDALDIITSTTGTAGSGSYRLVLTQTGSNPVISTTSVVTVSAVPAAPGASAPPRCGPGVVTITATGGATGQYRWYTSAGVLIAGVTAPTISPSLTTTTSYLVAINNGICEGPQTSVTAVINPVPPTPGVTDGYSCGPGVATLVASGGVNGQYRWATAAGVIGGQTNDTYTPSITATTTYTVYIDNGTCKGPAASITATLRTLPSAPGATGGFSCGPGTVTLTATGASSGQYRWYDAASNPIAGQTGSTYSPSITATTNYFVAINDGFCESTKKSITATLVTPPAAPGASGGSSCGPGTVILTATGASAGQYRWYTSAGVLIAGITSATYSPSIIITTNYFVSIFNGTCESSQKLVTGTINAIPPAPGASGNSTCGPGAVTLNATGGSAGQYRWYTSAGVLISGQTGSSYSPSVTTTTSYLVSINNGFCEGPSTSVTATVNSVPAAPGATGNSSCGPATIALNATGASSGQYRWYTSAGVLIAGQTGSSYSPSVTTTTSYLVTINNGFCEGPSTSVTATVNNVPAAPGATGNASCGAGTITLNATGGSAGQYRWYTSASVLIAGQTANAYAPFVSTTTSFFVSINNGTCESPKTSVTAVVNTIPGAPGATGNSSCGPGTITLNATGGSAGQYRWYTSAGVLIGGQTASTYSPSVTTTTNYFVSINNGTCESAQTSVTATVNTVPIAPGTTGNSSCGPATITLNATGASAGQYRWYTSAGVLIAGQTGSSYSPSVTTTTNFSVSIDNGTCESAKTPVTATVNTVPGAPGATGNSTCGPGTVTLNATGASAGQYRWYTSAGVLIGGQTASTYSPSVTTTTNYFVSINNGTCESTQTSVTATVNPIPAAPTTSGNFSCIPAVITLNAFGGLNGQYRWYTGPVGGSPIAGQTSSTFLTALLSVTTTYYVSINDGNCESPRTPVTAAINLTPTGPTATGGSTCGPGTVTLTASGASAGQFRWYTAAGVLIGGQTNATYSPSVTITTDFLVAINNGICQSPQTLVTATVNTIPAAPGASGNANCGPGTITLNATGASPGQYRWYTSAGVQIGGQTNGVYAPSVTTTTSYLVSIYNGFCESTKISVTATVNPLPPLPGATGNSSCGPATITLNATGGSSGQYRWYTSAGVLISGQTNASYSPSVATTTSYLVSINNGTCEGPQASVTATVNTVPTAPGATGNSSCGPATITLNATGGSTGQYRWYTNASVLISGQTSASYSPSVTATTNYFVSIDNGTCESAKTPVTATVNIVPSAPGGVGDFSCGPGTVTLTATGGTPGQYRWYNPAGTLITGQTGASYSTSVTATSTYSVSISNGTCESAKTSVVATINTPPGAPGATGNSSCGPGTITLNATGGSAGQYRWYTSSGVLIASQTGSSYAPSVTNTTSYFVSINDGTCESAQTSVIATVNNIPSAPGTSAAASCGAATLTLNASGGTNGQYRWYSVSVGGTAIVGQTNSAFSTGLISASVTYYVSINNGLCEGPRTSVTATINSNPPTPVATGGALCGPGIVTLGASGGSNGQYRWYFVPTGGTAISGAVNSTLLTGSISTTTNYYVSLNFGACEGARALAVATINTVPTTPIATGASGCGPSAVTLSASGGSNGEYRWYDASNVLINGATTSAFITPVISANTNYYVSINNGTCESAKASVTAVINTLPTAPSATGNATCGTSSVALNAVGGSNGQFRWYTAAGALINGQTNSVYITPSISTTTTFFVSINNGICESVKTPVIAAINTLPTTPTVTSASSCGMGTIVLTASGGTAGQYRWYTSAGTIPINGETANTFSTFITSTTTYLVSIDNGTCEGGKAEVTATINNIPDSPTASGKTACGPATIALSASGGVNGQYRWYTVATGGIAINGQVNSTYTTPSLTATTSFFVSINDGTCESERTPVVATINTCIINLPPVIAPLTSKGNIGGELTIDLLSQISDPDNNIDPTTLSIKVEPVSGAKASIVNGQLILDYKELSFTGTDKIIIGVCDLEGACTQQEFDINITGDFHVYTGMSPNGDGKNDLWILENIDRVAETKLNHVTIFNRWGDAIFETDNYDNVNHVFGGIGKNGSEVPAGTYFFKIEFSSGKETETGYLSLKR